MADLLWTQCLGALTTTPKTPTKLHNLITHTRQLAPTYNHNHRLCYYTSPICYYSKNPFNYGGLARLTYRLKNSEIFQSCEGQKNWSAASLAKMQTLLNTTACKCELTQKEVKSNEKFRCVSNAACLSIVTYSKNPRIRTWVLRTC